jgi:hypothetical protein
MHCRNVYLRTGFVMPCTEWALAYAGGDVTAGASMGVVARRSVLGSHLTRRAPAACWCFGPQLMSAYQLDRMRLLKTDIEGSEFAIFGGDEDLH